MQERMDMMCWNKEVKTPIALTVHGTTWPVANSISRTGFATLSSLDAGWYGTGIYFSTYFVYVSNYLSASTEPSVIISFVLLGNIYPVIEHVKQNPNLLGCVLKPPHNSHYVLVDSVGHIYDPTKTKDEFYDEIVVAQEAQIVPVYLIKFSVTSKFKNFLRQKKI
eukprot:TRINITY_DN2641_c0_g1_i6.p1 TRINITY_DN2641_c0_g1~~TRINITY_DN2641_c0_g1_i6.p1  ORF type:complete len:165 (+),score=34.26 TRINITY_DN2641_c0_g1_i6:321-815(+)